MGYIYKITNEINQKVYIGLTSKSIEERWKQHIQASKNLSLNRPLYVALRKYGIENFSIKLIEEVDDDFLGEREIYWITYYNSYKNGYNATLGGDGKWTKKVKQYNLSGQLIAIYKNAFEAAQYNEVSEESIRAVCRKQYKTLNNYIFIYEDDDRLISDIVNSTNINNYYTVKVYQYDLSGQLLNIWNSIKEAEKNTGFTNLSRSVNASKPHHGYIWRTEEYTFFDNLDLTSIIVQLSNDDKIIAYYDSFSQAAKSLGKKSSSSISESCRNIGYHKTAYGYKWRYLKDVL